MTVPVLAAYLDRLDRIAREESAADGNCDAQ